MTSKGVQVVEDPRGSFTLPDGQLVSFDQGVAFIKDFLAQSTCSTVRFGVWSMDQDPPVLRTDHSQSREHAAHMAQVMIGMGLLESYVIQEIGKPAPIVPPEDWAPFNG